ncbi:XRE family transcriptional regulator [Micromonospora sp. NBC_01699]|uniref:XRE family transcriptional regulator n=1 Tax=Micromonospora sp. NBC_01699 TaxID=2975984 RepID=UPI002E375F36|nr:XRE family transcriptional regulator [Micromonospora sp. NBC_01699]
MAAAPKPVSVAVARARFGAWVQRTLEAARDRGLTDRQIAKATGVGTSTFHRWRIGDWKELPEVRRVEAFAVGLQVDVDPAWKALGIGGASAPVATPELPLPPEVRTILRALADPNVSSAQKAVIREMLTMLADRAESISPRRTRSTTDEAAG